MEKTQRTTEYVTDIEKDTNFYLARIRQIDKILEHPVKTLIRLAEDGGELVYFPTWISESVEPKKEEDHLLTRCLCCSTLQRLSRVRRRFTWLDKDSQTKLDSLGGKLVLSFTPKDPSDFRQCVELLYSDTFGGLNPLTASQVFRVLLEAGEDHAHGSVGFVAFFAMVWPLRREFPDRLTIGARIEPWEVTAYITEKCLLPGKTLHIVITKRADLLDAIAKNLGELGKLASSQKTAQSRWEFNVEIDDLSANLHQLSIFSIGKEAFRDCAKEVEALSDRTDIDSQNEGIYKEVLMAVGKALISVRKKSKDVLEGAEKIMAEIRDNIVKHLKTMSSTKMTPEEKNCALKQLTDPPLRLRFADEYLDNVAYWNDLARAAEESCDYCDEALKELKAACQICPQIEDWEAQKDRIEGAEETFTTALKDIAAANRKVLELLQRPVRDATRWCRSVVDREIAHASAENITDFDPCELVSAIGVAVRWNLMTTPLQVSDAVTKALAGARGDGSWRPGRPFYSPNHAYGTWAATSDIVWTLTSAIEQFRGVTVADDELLNYVNWLERTQITLIPSPAPGSIQATYVGWASERLRDRSKIQPGITALSINALLEIRDLVEYRLWQLCKKRFSVVRIDKFLKDVDPVDLGAAHPKRLHRRLTRMAQKAQGPNYKSAEYSLVLHGPPGSSKTKVAEALSAEMWKSSSRWGPREPRLIRITPADFTRSGEDRIDSEARMIFDLISGVRAVTIVFDEIDDLLRQRNTRRDAPQFMDLVVPAMLNRLADLRSACPRQEISFLLATNYVENIDSALIRKGRIDDSIPVVYPDLESRLAIISRYLGKEGKVTAAGILDEERLREFAGKTSGWPYLAITSACDTLAKGLEGPWSHGAPKADNDNAFSSVLDKTIRDHKTSFSKPTYDDRRRYSPELSNEYWHHIISCCQSRDECRNLFYKETRHKEENIRNFLPEIEEPGSPQVPSSASCSKEYPFVDKFFEALNSVLEKEGRWRQQET